MHTYRSRFSRVLRLGRIIGRLKSVPFKTIQVAWIWIPLLVQICVLVWISVAEIKYHNQKQLTEKRFIMAYSFRSTVSITVERHGTVIRAISWTVTFSSTNGKKKAWTKSAARLTSQSPSPMMCILQHIITLPNISKQCHLVGTECLNRQAYRQ